MLRVLSLVRLAIDSLLLGDHALLGGSDVVWDGLLRGTAVIFFVRLLLDDLVEGVPVLLFACLLFLFFFRRWVFIDTRLVEVSRVSLGGLIQASRALHL